LRGVVQGKFTRVHQPVGAAESLEFLDRLLNQ
jgi:hypothetical protein